MNTGLGADRRASRRKMTVRPSWLHGLFFVPLVIACALLGAGPLLQARAQIVESNESVRQIVVTLHKSRTLRFDQQFSSAVVGSPDIVDALPMSDRALYIQGKKIGTTNVSVFDQNMRLIGVVDVEVTPDIGNLQQKIRASSGSRGIRVSASNGQI